MLVLPTPVAPKNAALRGPCSHGGSAPPSRVMRYAEMHLFCIWSSISIEILVVVFVAAVVASAVAFAFDPLAPAAAAPVLILAAVVLALSPT